MKKKKFCRKVKVLSKGKNLNKKNVMIKKRESKLVAKKMLSAVQCWLTQGWEADEKTQPILSTERPIVV
jgi:hypothetical protein